MQFRAGLLETNDEVRLFYNDQHYEPLISLDQSSRPINDTKSDVSPYTSSGEFYDSEEKHLPQSETDYFYDDQNVSIFKTPENIEPLKKYSCTYTED